METMAVNNYYYQPYTKSEHAKNTNETEGEILQQLSPPVFIVGTHKNSLHMDQKNKTKNGKLPWKPWQLKLLSVL